VNINGMEHLFGRVVINCPGETTMRVLESGETKYEVTFYPNSLQIDEKNRQIILS
jgi:hypothetical protein